MFKSIDHFLAALGNVRAMKKIHVDTYTEDRIHKIEGTKIAGDELHGVWVKFGELAGYKFVDVTMLSTVGIKTFKGISIAFLGGDVEMFMDSDTKEVVSDYSNVSNRWITHASFDVTDEDIDFITQKNYDLICVKDKKKSFNFKTIR